MFAAMASVAFASCVKNEPAFSVAEDDAIVFNAPVMGVPTKTQEYVGTEYTGPAFSVYGWYHTTDFADVTTATLYMDNVSVVKEDPAQTYPDGVGTFRPAENYYWPKNGKLSFVAYSPTAVPDGATLTSICNDPKGMTLTYTVHPTDTSKHVDLLYSNWATDKTSSVGADGGFGGVDIAFNHALSVVKVYIKAEDANAASAVSLKSVTLNGVYGAGQLTLTPSSQTWKATGSTINYTLLGTKNAAAETINVTGTKYANYILVPQTLTSDSEIVIEWYLKHGTKYLEQKSVIELSTAIKDANNNGTIDNTETTVVSKWEMSKRYIYTITMGVEDIYFAPTVVDWTETVNVPVLSK